MIIKTVQEFYQKVTDGGVIICFDLGLKKIGIALSTPDQSFSLPLKVIREVKQALQIRECVNEIIKNNAVGIVIGLPLNMDGSIGAQSNIAIEFANKLGESSMLPIFMQDERLTSKEADNILKATGFNRKKREKMDDAVAANLILETTLNLMKFLS